MRPTRSEQEIFRCVGIRPLFLKHPLHNAQGCINVICEGSSVYSTERVPLLMIFSQKIMVLSFYVDSVIYQNMILNKNKLLFL